MPIPAVTLCRRRSGGGAQMRGGGKRKGLVPVKGKPDAGIAPVEATNFIRNIIKQDLSSGKHASIVTRFPPEPNGYLHIGHAKAICVNFGLGQEFGGATYMRLDDTNPAKEEQEYVDSILADVKWLGSAAWSNYPCSPTRPSGGLIAWSGLPSQPEKRALAPCAWVLGRRGRAGSSGAYRCPEAAEPTTF